MFGGGHTMAGDHRGSLVASIVTNAARSRIQNYREQAAHFEELAQGETDYKLRNQLLILAARYHELVKDLEPDGV
jgi:hypothetical protein